MESVLSELQQKVCKVEDFQFLEGEFYHLAFRGSKWTWVRASRIWVRHNPTLHEYSCLRYTSSWYVKFFQSWLKKIPGCPEPHVAYRVAVYNEFHPN